MVYNSSDIAEKNDLNKEEFENFVMAYCNKFNFSPYDGASVDFKCDNLENIINTFKINAHTMNEEGDGNGGVSSILNTDPENLRKSADGFETLADKIEDIQNMSSSLNEDGKYPEFLTILEFVNERLQTKKELVKRDIKESIMSIFNGKTFINEGKVDEVKEFKNLIKTNVLPKLSDIGIDGTKLESYRKAEEYAAKGDYVNADRMYSRALTDMLNHIHSSKGELNESEPIRINKGRLMEIISQHKKTQ